MLNYSSDVLETKSSGLIGFTGEFHRTFKEDMPLFSHKALWREKKGPYSIPFMLL